MNRSNQYAAFAACYARIVRAAPGGVPAIAERYKSCNVTEWKRNGVPKERVRDLEQWLGIPRHEINPAFYTPQHTVFARGYARMISRVQALTVESCGVLPAPTVAAKIVSDKLRITRTAVKKWEDFGIPPERMDALEEWLGIPRHELNPTVYNNPLDEIQKWTARGVDLSARHGSSPLMAA